MLYFDCGAFFLALSWAHKKVKKTLQHDYPRFITAAVAMLQLGRFLLRWDDKTTNNDLL